MKKLVLIGMVAAGAACMPLAFGDDAGVVGAFIVTGKLGQHLPRARLRDAVAELVGEAQEQHDQSLLILRLDGEYVQADAFGLPRLIEQPVAFRFPERNGDGFGGDGLQLEHATNIQQKPLRELSG